jgi:exopolysaccharide biosynthesis polyprenyl glycosylphosphotransferase
MIVDVLVLEIAYLLSYFVRHGIIRKFSFNNFNQPYLQMGIILLLSYFVVQLFEDDSNGIFRRGYMREAVAVVRQNTAIMIILMLYMFVMKQSALYSRIMVGCFGILSCLLMYLARIIWKKSRSRFTRERGSQVNMLILSEVEQAERIGSTLMKEPYHDIWPIGIAFIDGGELKEFTRIGKIPVVAGEYTWKEYIKKQVVDEVLIKSSCSKRKLEEVTGYLLSMGIVVHIDIESISADMPNKVVSEVGGNVVVTTSVKSAVSYQIIFKRLMDIFGSLLGLLITGIAFLIFAPIIYLQSPGPVLFTQKRVGKNGRIFRIYKFRSMHLDAEERKKELMKDNKMSGLMFKMDNDPRIIPIGRFMRRMSLDELPQFLNILKGDMSLVGTRPPTVEEYENYDFRHRIRLSIKPGLTGLWQVSGRSNITDFEEVVALDQKYIREWSLGEDIKILAKTLKVVFVGDGAA